MQMCTATKLRFTFKFNFTLMYRTLKLKALLVAFLQFVLQNPCNLLCLPLYMEIEAISAKLAASP